MKTCRKCGETKPLDGFHLNGRGSGRRHSRCKVCKRQAAKEWQARTGGGKRGAHGLTIGQAREYRKGKACAACGDTEMLRVDHDHETGEIRGVLCHWCNMALGYAKDDTDRLRSLIAYLEESLPTTDTHPPRG